MKSEGRFNFDYHVSTLLKKASKKYHALATVCNYIDTKKRRVLMSAFITSQFFYCRFVWMFHSRTLNNQINKIHEKALRLVYKDETFLSFALRKRCRYSKLFWSAFSRIWTEYGEIRSISPYSVGMRENTHQNNSEYRHFSRSVYDLLKREKSVNIHQKNLQILATEIHKTKNDLEPEIMIK